MIEQICRQYYPNIFRYIRSRVKDDCASSDLAQDVFLRAYKGFDQLLDRERAKAWLFSIAHNVVQDFRKKVKRELPAAEASEAPWAGPSAEQNWMDHPCLPSCLHFMIDQLPEQHRQLLYLADLQQMPQKEIADLLDRPYPTVKSQVQRARLQLKKSILDCCDVEVDKYGNVLDIRPKDPAYPIRCRAINGDCPLPQ